MDRYAVFGNPIGHSKSPLIHRWFAEQTGQDLQYEAILAPVDGFADSWHAVVRAGGKGGNVTMPFKEQAFAQCHVLTERAKIAKAVNTLWMQDGQLHGDNTDGQGLVDARCRHLRWRLPGGQEDRQRQEQSRLIGCVLRQLRGLRPPFLFRQGASGRTSARSTYPALLIVR